MGSLPCRQEMLKSFVLTNPGGGMMMIHSHLSNFSFALLVTVSQLISQLLCIFYTIGIRHPSSRSTFRIFRRHYHSLLVVSGKHLSTVLRRVAGTLHMQHVFLLHGSDEGRGLTTHFRNHPQKYSFPTDSGALYLRWQNVLKSPVSFL